MADDLAIVNYKLADQITGMDNEVKSMMNGQQPFRIEKAIVIVNQIGVFLLLTGNRNYSHAIEQETDRNHKLTFDYAGTFNGWKVYVATGAQVALAFFTAASGMGFLGQTLAQGSSGLAAVAGLPQVISGLFNNSNESERALIEMSRQDLEFLRRELADMRSKNVQQMNGDIGNIKEINRLLQEIATQVLRVG